MQSTAFRRIVAKHLEGILGEALGLTQQDYKGIDLFDEDIGIELKCRYSKWWPSFTIHAYQIDEFKQDNQGKKLFWAFALYNLNKAIPDIQPEDDLSVLVKDVTFRFAPWNFVRKFPVHNAPTADYIYVHEKNLINSKVVPEVYKNTILLLPEKSILLEKFQAPKSPVILQATDDAYIF